MLKFPKDFFWGAATSAYQVEGGNINSDWWEWEKRVGFKEPSGPACRHYEFYRRDFDLASELNQNAHRLSIEWSRIEPREGEFSEAEIGHYLDVILALRERNIEPVVTLHHFTNPLWFAKLGGWQNKDSPLYFSRYTERIIKAFCGKVKFWVTINEPMVYVYHAYILGVWPPQRKSFFDAARVTDNLIAAHIKAYRAIHDIYKTNRLLPPMVSIAKNLQFFMPCVPSLKNRIAVYLRETNFNFKFINRLLRHKALDFIGVNYYTRGLVEAANWGIKSLLMDVCSGNHSRLKKNSLGWDIYPEGLYRLLIRMKKYGLPVFILENGICTQDDAARWEFIREHLKSLHLAMAQGTKVLGYLYWSLLDNFEWDKGFAPRFGLVEVDYATSKRTIRESARKFSLVCKRGELD